VVNAAMGNKDRMAHMKAFFAGVGDRRHRRHLGRRAEPAPDFRAKLEKQGARGRNQKKLDKAEKARIAAKAEEMI
jgi:chlorophyllide a reductase subunit Y